MFVRTLLWGRPACSARSLLYCAAQGLIRHGALAVVGNLHLAVSRMKDGNGMCRVILFWAWGEADQCQKLKIVFKVVIYIVFIYILIKMAYIILLIIKLLCEKISHRTGGDI